MAGDVATVHILHRFDVAYVNIVPLIFAGKEEMLRVSTPRYNPR
jgi:hypothetical protein